VQAEVEKSWNDKVASQPREKTAAELARLVGAMSEYRIPCPKTMEDQLVQWLGDEYAVGKPLFNRWWEKLTYLAGSMREASARQKSLQLGQRRAAHVYPEDVEREEQSVAAGAAREMASQIGKGFAAPSRRVGVEDESRVHEQILAEQEGAGAEVSAFSKAAPEEGADEPQVGAGKAGKTSGSSVADYEKLLAAEGMTDEPELGYEGTDDEYTPNARAINSFLMRDEYVPNARTRSALPSPILLLACAHWY
jgi:hypothetical protein